MRWRGKAVVIVAASAAGALVWAGLTFREASSAINQGREAVGEAGRIRFERRAWEPPASAFELLPARPDWRDAAWFAGSLWLAGSGGLARYSAEGTLQRQWLAGAELPPAPLTALAAGIDPRGGGQVLFAATAGEGLLIIAEDGRMELMRAAEQPARDILALLPLADGRVLLGTQQAGALVYDATGMNALHADLASGHVVALAGVPEQLWIATLEQGLVRFQAGGIERFDEQSGIPDKRILSLAFAGDTLFAGTAVGVAELEHGAFRRALGDGFFASALWSDGDTLDIGTLDEGVAEVPLNRSRNTRAGQVGDAGPRNVRRLLDVDGELYAVTPDALWQRAPDGAWRAVLEPRQEGLRDRNVSAAYVDSGRRLWVGYFDHGLDLLDGRRVVAHVEDDVLYCVNRIAGDADRDYVAVATANGLAFLDSAGKPRQILRREDGLMANHVTDIAFRPDGWAAATPAGLTLFDAAGMRGLYALHGLVNNHVYTVVARGETLLAGTLGGLSVLEGGVVRRSYTTANSPLKHNWISAVAEFRGDWLVGTYGAGVARLSDAGEWRVYEDMAGVELNPNALTVSPTRAYAGTLDRGLLVYSPEPDAWRFVTQGLPSANVTALAYGQGTLYVGTDNGLALIAEDSLSLQ